MAWKIGKRARTAAIVLSVATGTGTAHVRERMPSGDELRALHQAIGEDGSKFSDWNKAKLSLDGHTVKISGHGPGEWQITEDPLDTENGRIRLPLLFYENQPDEKQPGLWTDEIKRLLMARPGLKRSGLTVTKIRIAPLSYKMIIRDDKTGTESERSCSAFEAEFELRKQTRVRQWLERIKRGKK